MKFLKKISRPKFSKKIEKNDDLGLFGPGKSFLGRFGARGKKNRPKICLGGDFLGQNGARKSAPRRLLRSGALHSAWFFARSPEIKPEIINEVRSDAIDVDIFYKKCIATNNCKINKQDGQLKKEITKQILAKAAIYQKQIKDKNFKPYRMPREKKD